MLGVGARDARSLQGAGARVMVSPRVRTVATAGGLGLLTFAFRFLTLRDFPNDHYMYLAWAQQLLFGAVPGRDFVEPGYPLTYATSALIQHLAPGPLSEAVFTMAMLSVATALTVLVIERITGSLKAAALAGGAVIAMQPQLYNYPKLIVPVVALWLVWWHERQPSTGRRAVLAAWTTIAFLMRHDLGLYVAAAVVAAFAVATWDQLRTAARRIGEYLAVGLLMVLPYLLFLQWAQGIAEHIRQTIEFSKNEPPVLRVPTPDFPFLSSGNVLEWGADDSLATLYYFARLLVPLAAIVLVTRRRAQAAGVIPVVTAAIVLLAAYDVVILRHPIVTRIHDLAVPMTVVGAWVCWELIRPLLEGGRSRQAFRYASVLVAAVIAVSTLGSVAILGHMQEQVKETRLFDGWPKMVDRANDVMARTTTWPWPVFWPTGQLPSAIEYIAQCTSPTDHVLMTWPATEYYFFTRRPFAAGHALFLAPYSFTGVKDQEFMLDRLQREHVPIALVNETRAEQFATTYPLLDQYIRKNYAAVDTYEIYDGSQIALAVRRDAMPSRSYGPNGWPCGFGGG